MGYLITGQAGTGKTTIHNALSKAGKASFDADFVPGLGAWTDLTTGKCVHVAMDSVIDFSRVGYNWCSTAIKALASETDDHFFLCGRASNQAQLYSLFRHVFVLTLDPETHDKRLRERSESSFGKDPIMRHAIIAEQPRLIEEAIALGALALDASQPVETTVGAILAKIEDAG